MHALPTPLGSKESSPADSRSVEKSPQPYGLDHPTKSETSQNNEAFLHPNAGSYAGGQGPELGTSKSGVVPTQSKDNASSQLHEAKGNRTSAPQPQVYAAPTQKHVKSGAAVGARAHGTVPIGGDGIESSKSELPDPHIHEDEDTFESREEQLQHRVLPDSPDENLNGNGKKEGRVRKVVHKMKDKLSHRNH